MHPASSRCLFHASDVILMTFHASDVILVTFSRIRHPCADLSMHPASFCGRFHTSDVIWQTFSHIRHHLGDLVMHPTSCPIRFRASSLVTVFFHLRHRLGDFTHSFTHPTSFWGCSLDARFVVPVPPAQQLVRPNCTGICGHHRH